MRAAVGRVDAEAGVSALPLRDDARLFIVSPDQPRDVGIPLAPEGSYFCVSFVGEPVLIDARAPRRLAAAKLHILRRPAAGERRRVDFEQGALAALIHVSEQWCRSCPNGPSCKVAQFLLHGEDGRRGPADQTLEMDEQGCALAKALLKISVDEDVDILSIEMNVLALVSWVFGRRIPSRQARTLNGALPPRTAMKTRQAAEILRRRLGDPPTILELSALVGLNENDLKRGFKKLYGATIAGYSRQRRLEAARDLLTYSSFGVARIASEIGFANPSQFARAFRLQFGRNPSDFRRAPE